MAEDEALPVIIDPEPTTGAEVDGLARWMAAAYERSVAWYRREMRITPVEADARAREHYAARPSDAERVAALPPDRISWTTLATLQAGDPEAALAVWERLKATACEELESGSRAADVLAGSPWERAQFVALLQSLIDEWQPRGGVERLLIDSLALAQTAHLYWLNRLHDQAANEGIVQERAKRTDGYWSPATISAAESMEQCAAMADRWNRIMLRTLRSLRDLRRYSGPIAISARQVNIGERQINVATEGDTDG